MTMPRTERSSVKTPERRPERRPEPPTRNRPTERRYQPVPELPPEARKPDSPAMRVLTWVVAPWVVAYLFVKEVIRDVPRLFGAAVRTVGRLADRISGLL